MLSYKKEVHAMYNRLTDDGYSPFDYSSEYTIDFQFSHNLEECFEMGFIKTTFRTTSGTRDEISFNAPIYNYGFTCYYYETIYRTSTFKHFSFSKERNDRGGRILQKLLEAYKRESTILDDKCRKLSLWEKQYEQAEKFKWFRLNKKQELTAIKMLIDSARVEYNKQERIMRNTYLNTEY